MSRLYVILDVFTSASLTGNPVAVVLDAAGLDGLAMQAIARQFNLSETVFLLPAADENRKAGLRIFMPHRELPFAGHPTVGAAVLLGLMDAVAGNGRESRFEIEEPIGVISCETRATGRRSGHARFGLPRLPEPAGDAPSSSAAAAALDLDEAEIGFDRHVVSRYTAGNAFTFVPVRSLAALGRAQANSARWGEAFGNEFAGVFVYTRETGDPALDFRARMLEPAIGEDPATGSAAAAFAGALMAFEDIRDGSRTLAIGQGFEMGRPSRIELTIEAKSGALVSAAIGGSAVVTTEGTLFLD